MTAAKTSIRWVVSLGALVVAAALAPAAQTPSRARLLVLLKGGPPDATWAGGGALAIVDPVTGKEVGRVPTGENAHEVTTSADGRLAFLTAGVINGTDKGRRRFIYVIDVVAQKGLRRVDIGPLSNPHGIQFAGGKVYFTAEGYKMIGRYDPVGNQMDWFHGIGQNRTHMLVLSKDMRKIFTANGDGSSTDTVSVIEGSGPADWKVAVIPVGNGPEAIELSPNGREVWTATYGDGGITVIDVPTNKVTRTLNVQTKRSNRLKFSPDGKLALVSDSQGGELVILDAAAGKVIKRIPIGKPPVTGIQVAPDGSRAYVAAEGDDNIAVIDLKTLELKGRISFPPARSRPDGMAWAAMR
jgi:DNA-binding beta-propeller fold protein YncE